MIQLLIWILVLACAPLAGYLIEIGIGPLGSLGYSMSPLMMALYWVLVAHLTITCMSLCFHRQHTHQGVRLHPAVDTVMQAWLWLFTSMSKRDWVSVHVYHHIHSDTEKDPHSPVMKGLGHVFFLGVLDYTRAKRDPEVLKIRNKIKESSFEAFIDKNLFLGPILLATTHLVLFGPVQGAIVSVGAFLISPLLAVGGVNALAHWFGYRNHRTTDNSRNLGFLFPLNWVICGELDHNNHHHFPNSCSFRHRWYEFDIGYAYLKILSWMGLAEIRFAATLSGQRAKATAPATDSVFSPQIAK